MATILVSGSMVLDDIRSHLDTSDARGPVVNASDILLFDPYRTSTLACGNENLRVEGILRMRPASYSIVHTMTFAPDHQEYCYGVLRGGYRQVTGTVVSGTKVELTVTLLGSQTGHYFLPGDVINVSTSAVTEYNGDWTVLGGADAPTATTLRCNVTSAPGGPMTIGRIAPSHNALQRNIGLVFHEAAVADLVGSRRLGWGRSTVAIANAGTSFTLDRTPTGWQVGDEIVLCPTAENDYDTKFHEATITAISGRDITFTAAAARAYPRVTLEPGLTYGCEVLNLTRNVIVQGTDITHRSHTMIMNHEPVAQTIQWARFRFMGPRHAGITGVGGDLSLKQVGVWPLHFHKNDANNYGSLVEGVVVDKAGSHAFVNHRTDGITWRDCIAYDAFETPYWWDPGDGTPDDGGPGIEDSSEDTVYDRCVGAKVQMLGGNPANQANNLDGGEYLRQGAWVLGLGKGNTCRGCVAVGIGNESLGNNAINSQRAGFLWPERHTVIDGIEGHGQGVWTFTDNVAHNNYSNGTFGWQNENPSDHPPQLHDIIRFHAYHNAGNGIEHGAYTNRYLFDDCVLYHNALKQALMVSAVRRCGLAIHATTAHTFSSPRPMTMRNVRVDQGNLTTWAVGTLHRSALGFEALIDRCVFKGYTTAAWHVGPHTPNEDVFLIQHCEMGAQPFDFDPLADTSTLYRVQGLIEDPSLIAELRQKDQAGDLNAVWTAAVTKVAPIVPQYAKALKV